MKDELQRLLNESLFQPKPTDSVDEMAENLRKLHERNARIAELRAALRAAGEDPDLIKPNVGGEKKEEEKKDTGATGPSGPTGPTGPGGTGGGTGPT
ncbi:MAG: hypothetical protein EBT15_12385, partial [Betaproteobacteria bacterium]|nr:hypothetical protein [Betaproteobacteria bacterium]